MELRGKRSPKAPAIQRRRIIDDSHREKLLRMLTAEHRQHCRTSAVSW
jgi:hypothetical protein